MARLTISIEVSRISSGDSASVPYRSVPVSR